jgi:hypothetical protein
MNKELKYIDNVFKGHKKQKMIEYYTKNKYIFDVVISFIERKRLLLYGGSGLNNLIPIYDKHELPDYDCLSYRAKDHAIELADTLFAEGVEFVEVRPSLHSGTFKVFANFIPVADITQVNETFFISIAKLSEAENRKLINKNLMVVPTHLLKHFMLKEFARPEGSIHRWKKLINRYHKVEKIKQGVRNKKITNEMITNTKKITYDDEGINKIISDIGDILRLRKYPIIGTFALSKMTGYECRENDFFSIYDILSSEPEKTLKTILGFIEYDKSKYKIVTSKRFFYQEILPRRLRVYIKIKGKKEPIKLMTIIDVETNCYSTIKKDGFIFGSPYTVLQFLYAYWVMYKVYEKPNIPNITQKLINTCENYIRKKATLKEKFSTECFGHEKSLESIKKDKWLEPNRRFLYRPRP